MDIEYANFENILLRKILNSNEFFSKTQHIIKAKYFQNQGNVEVFKLIKSHYITYQKIPSLTELAASIKNIPNAITRGTIADSLRNVSKVEEVKDTQFMIDETVKFVQDSILTEGLILGSDGLTQKDDSKKLKAKELFEEMTKVSVDTDLGLDFDDIETMIAYYKDKLVGIRTQHSELNKRIGAGFLPSTLSVIMAASGIGKSLLMTDLISSHITDKKNVLLVSMEMEDREIMKRVHANALDLPINDLKNLDPLVIRQAHERVQSQGIGKFYVKDFPNGSFSPLMLDALLDNYKNEIGIEFDIVYLDYLGIMRSDLISPSAGLYSYVKSIVEETRSIAKKRKIPIVSASQLNRCIRTDSIIETKEGLKKAKDIKCGDEVKSNNGYNTVISVSDIEKQKMYKIKTKSGREIICSGEHKFPTPHGPMSINIGLKKGEKLCSKN